MKGIVKLNKQIVAENHDPIHEKEFSELIIKLAELEEAKGEILNAYLIFKGVYKQQFLYSKDKNTKTLLTYFYAYYLSLVQENNEAIDLLILHNIDKKNSSHLGSIVLLSKLYKNQGNYEKALFWCDKGLNLINFDTNHKSYLRLMTNKINFNAELNRHQQVIVDSKKIAKMIQQDPYLESHYYTNLGNYYLSLKKYSLAREFFKKSKLIENREITYTIEDDFNISNSYQEEQDFENSAQLLSKTIRLLTEKYPNLRSDEVASIYQSQAKNYFFKNDRKNTTQFIDLALKNVNFKGSIKYFTGNRTSLLRIFIDRARFLQSTNTYFEADSLIDLMRREHTEQGSKLFWREKTHDFYENAIETSFATRDYKNAFYFMEKSRAILLLDALRELDARKILSPEQFTIEQSLRFKVIGFQNKLQSLNEKQIDYASTFKNLIEAKEQYQDFVISLEKSNPTYFQLKYQDKYLSLSDLQLKLKESKQTFVHFFKGQNWIYVMKIEANNVELKKIATTDFMPLYATILNNMNPAALQSKTSFDGFKIDSKKMFDLIFSDLKISSNRLIISQDEFFVPFAALQTDVGKFFVSKYAVSYAYSANTLFKQKSSKWLIFNRFVGFAPVEFKNNLATLYGSDKALNNVAKQYTFATQKQGQEATRKSFKSEAEKATIIQLFTHGLADSTENKTAIYFYDEPIKLGELYQLPSLDAELIILSACQTNLGMKAVGEGVMSFARGFAFLGVPSTVSTLWSVDNQSTYFITERFHEFLSNGLTKDEALQKAQLEYLAIMGNSHPYFWSGIVLIGETAPLHQSWLLLLSGFFLIGILCFVCYFFIMKKLKQKF